MQCELNSYSYKLIYNSFYSYKYLELTQIDHSIWTDLLEKDAKIATNRLRILPPVSLGHHFFLILYTIENRNIYNNIEFTQPHCLYTVSIEIRISLSITSNTHQYALHHASIGITSQHQQNSTQQQKSETTIPNKQFSCELWLFFVILNKIYFVFRFGIYLSFDIYERKLYIQMFAKLKLKTKNKKKTKKRNKKIYLQLNIRYLISI